MSRWSHVGHLARRFLGSLSRRRPSAQDSEWVANQLLLEEAMLWLQMPVQDRRHSIVVARRFVDLAPDAVRAEVAGALLHDVGKSLSGLGTIGRVVATVIGPHGRRFRSYHDHEALGVEMLRAADSEPETLALLGGSGRCMNELRVADDV